MDVKDAAFGVDGTRLRVGRDDVGHAFPFGRMGGGQPGEQRGFGFWMNKPEGREVLAGDYSHGWGLELPGMGSEGFPNTGRFWRRSGCRPHRQHVGRCRAENRRRRYQGRVGRAERAGARYFGQGKAG